jgi:hypothetical protein
LYATGVVYTGGKFTTDVFDTRHRNLPLVSLTPVANLPPVTTTQAKLIHEKSQKQKIS